MFGLTLTNTFDAVGNRTKREDNFGGILTSTYDAADRLTKREFGGSGQTPLRIDLTYTNRDQVETITRYSDLAGTNKIGSSTYTYDAPGRLSNLSHRNGSGSLLANYTYTYDLASRLTSEVLNGTTTNFGYDNTDQLTSDGSNSYSFDANGNRTMTGYQTGTGNRLTNDGTWTYTYDAEGNLSKKSKGPSLETWDYAYDNINHLTSVTKRASDGGTVQMQATYTYDVFGNRIQTEIDSDGAGAGASVIARFGFDLPSSSLGDVWVDLNSSNALQTRRLYLDAVDSVYARINSSGTAAWYLPDRLGSIRDVVDASGAVQDHIDYSGFGVITNETNASFGDRYKWTGREFDSESGLQYNRARYYEDDVGRWLSTDPLEFAAGDANLYRYAFNDTPEYTDPDGRIVHWHHLLPRAVFTELALRQLGLAHINIHSAALGWMLRPHVHQLLHSLGWNPKWAKWVEMMRDRGKPVSVAELRKQLSKMMNDPKYKKLLLRGQQATHDWGKKVVDDSRRIAKRVKRASTKMGKQGAKAAIQTAKMVHKRASFAVKNASKLLGWARIAVRYTMNTATGVAGGSGPRGGRKTPADCAELALVEILYPSGVLVPGKGAEVAQEYVDPGSPDLEDVTIDVAPLELLWHDDEFRDSDTPLDDGL